jgi:hypothetical protein
MKPSKDSIGACLITPKAVEWINANKRGDEDDGEEKENGPIKEIKFAVSMPNYPNLGQASRG